MKPWIKYMLLHTVQVSNRANANTRGRIKNRFGSAEEEEDSAIIERG
jgi:hypothetical protein